MVHLRTIQATAIRSIFEVLKDIINDVNVYFSPAGIKILTLDIARVTLVHVFLAAENFEEYSCPNEIAAGLNMANTHKLLKSVGNNDTLFMRIDNRDVLEIIVENTVKKSSTSYKLKLLDINEDILEVPAIHMDVITTLPSMDFQRITRDMGNLANDITITRDGTMLELACQGDFADQRTEIEYPEHVERVGNVFSLKYINLFTKATGMCSSVQLMQDTQNDGVIVFRYSIANLGDMKFYLAAKMDS